MGLFPCAGSCLAPIEAPVTVDCSYGLDSDGDSTWLGVLGPAPLMPGDTGLDSLPPSSPPKLLAVTQKSCSSQTSGWGKGGCGTGIYGPAFKTGWRGAHPPEGHHGGEQPSPSCLESSAGGSLRPGKTEESKPVERSPPCFLAQRRQNKSSTGHYLVST